jgi:hypothetical protein
MMETYTGIHVLGFEPMIVVWFLRNDALLSYSVIRRRMRLKLKQNYIGKREAAGLGEEDKRA